MPEKPILVKKGMEKTRKLGTINNQTNNQRGISRKKLHETKVIDEKNGQKTRKSLLDFQCKSKEK